MSYLWCGHIRQAVRVVLCRQLWEGGGGLLHVPFDDSW